MSEEYSGNSIHVAVGAEAHRLYPAQFLGANDIVGITNQLFELLDNAIDESIECYERAKIMYIENFGVNSKPLPPNLIKLEITETDEVIIEDEGRGLPISPNSKTGQPGIYLIFENASAGGKAKHGQGGYSTVTSGMHGAGACVSQACTKFMNITTNTNSNDPNYKGEFVLRYEQGIRKTEVKQVRAELLEHREEFRRKLGIKQTGTKIHYLFDEEVLKATNNGSPCAPYNKDLIRSRIEDILIGVQDKNCIEIHFKFKDDPTVIISPKDKEPKKVLNVTEETVNRYSILNIESSLPNDKDGYFKAEIHLYRKEELTNKNGATVIVNRLKMNNQKISDNIVKAINTEYYTGIKRLLRDNNKRVEDDILNEVADRYSKNYSMLVNMILNGAQFSGQTKDSLVSTNYLKEFKREIAKSVKNIIDLDEGILEAAKLALVKQDSKAKELKRLQEMELQQEKNKKEMEVEILKNRLRDDRLAIHDIENSNFKLKRSESTYPPQECYLLFVEGDSATGELFGQNRRYHICAVGGKVVNVAQSDDIGSIQLILAMLNQPFKGILIGTDADSDGLHIRMLLLAIIAKFAPKYLLEESVYVINSPHAKIENTSPEDIILESEDLLGENKVYKPGINFTLSQTETDLVKSLNNPQLKVLLKYEGLAATLSDDNGITIDMLIENKDYRKKILAPTEEDIAILEDALNESDMSVTKREKALESSTYRATNIRDNGSIIVEMSKFDFDPTAEYVDEPTVENNMAYTLFPED